MANRRSLLALNRHASALFTSTNPSIHSLTTPFPISTHQPLKTLTAKLPLFSTDPEPALRVHWLQQQCLYSSNRGDDKDDEGDEDDEEEEEEDDDHDEEEEEAGNSSEEDEDDDVSASNAGGSRREYSAKEKEAEAAAIGYEVIGPLEKSDRVFKPYEPVYAVVQIGSHQFKVSNGDCIFTERLKFCEVNDKIVLNKVLLLGSRSQTIVGRPIVSEAAVHAVVEEHALDAKVLIFKKKRRKNYRRTKGHRQELSKLRITDIQGIEKPEIVDNLKPSKATSNKSEKVAVAT